MDNLILVRHSLPLIQSELPYNQWPLSKEGLRRAALLPSLLAPLKPSRIFTSSEVKAMQTGQEISEALGLPLLVESGLHEHERLQSTSQTSREGFETSLSAFFEHPDQLIFGLETADDAYLRFSSSVDQLIKSFPQSSLVVVSHGTVLSLLVSHRCGVAPFQFWKQLGLPSIIVLSLPNFLLQYVIETIQ